MWATYWFLFLLFVHQGSQWVHVHVSIFVCGVKTRDGWCSLEISIHVFGHNSFCPNILCSSAPSCRSCCFYAHPAAVKWKSLSCASAESKRWSMIQTWPSILSANMLLLHCFQPQLNRSWKDRLILDPAASAACCTVHTSDVSWSLCQQIEPCQNCLEKQEQ